MEQQKAQTMDIDKVDVNIEEEDPWEEIPGCEFDGIGMEENKMWDPKVVFEARSEEVNFMKSLGCGKRLRGKSVGRTLAASLSRRSGWTSTKGGAARFRFAAG